jgi:5-methyltetrahydropteroyltriglutamate--homocysteine methyltransferase
LSTSQKLFPTAIVGSHAQPDWFIDRQQLKGRLPPRVRAKEIWKVGENDIREAGNDATRLAIQDQEKAGVDIIGDGEMRRESYSNHVANALSGIDPDKHGTAMDRTGKPNPVPLVSGPIERLRPIEVENATFLRSQTKRRTKITLPGPFTMTQQAQNDYYASDADLAMAYAAALNQEIREVFAAGIDIVQLDEPYLQARPDEARDYGVAAINKALDETTGTSALHMCFGYAFVSIDSYSKPDRYAFLAELNDCAVDIISVETAQPNLDLSTLSELDHKMIMLGVIDMNNLEAETPRSIADRITVASNYVDAERLIIAPDCGMKYIDRPLACEKLVAMVQGAELARQEVS